MWIALSLRKQKLKKGNINNNLSFFSKVFCGNDFHKAFVISYNCHHTSSHMTTKIVLVYFVLRAFNLFRQKKIHITFDGCYSPGKRNPINFARFSYFLTHSFSSLVCARIVLCELLRPKLLKLFSFIDFLMGKNWVAVEWEFLHVCAWNFFMCLVFLSLVTHANITLEGVDALLSALGKNQGWERTLLDVLKRKLSEMIFMVRRMTSK